jgi:multiple sugar transport system permease protein
MPIIANIGRRHWRVRAFIAVLYVVLTAGAATMIYPFAIMIAGATKSGADDAENRPIPSFLANRDSLWRKYAEAQQNESFEMARMTYGAEGATFRDLTFPAAPDRPLVSEWESFVRESDLPNMYYRVGMMGVLRTRGAQPERLRQFKREMIERFDGDLDRMNRETDSDFASWQSLLVREPDLLGPLLRPGRRGFDLALADFKSRQPVSARCYLSIEGYYRYMVLPAKYGRSIASFNASNETAYTAWSEVPLDARVPAGPGRTDGERRNWESFARHSANPIWLRAEPAAAGHWQAFLRAKYGTVETFNHRHGTSYASLDAIPLSERAPEEVSLRTDWCEFVGGWVDPDSGITHKLPIEHLRVVSVEHLFRDWLRARHGTLEAFNATRAAAGAPAFVSWEAVMPPQRDLHALDLAANAAHVRWEFVRRNFITVWDYLFLHGRAFRNTLIYVLLSVVASLIVNPIAAYALSRYKPRSTYKMLLFLMLTMAFPHMVTQIPVFLMLRQFGLLNSFWALVLPGLASGYSIFMLKGFFDSLPQELYESAELDGAGEFRIFWTITMSLSTPILAVKTLGAFTHAYSNFMFALLICQDEKMWTLMPWLYQLQQRSSEGVVFASLIIAAIPTLLVFCFCQKIIMRGIVVPVEK